MEELINKCKSLGIKVDLESKEVYVLHGSATVPKCVSDLIKNHDFKLSFTLF